MTPLTVSRATARLDEVKEFYTSDIGAETMYNEVYDDGSEVLVLAYTFPDQVV